MKEIYFRMQLRCYLGYSRCVSNSVGESIKLDTHFLKSVGLKSISTGQDVQYLWSLHSWLSDDSIHPATPLKVMSHHSAS